MSQVLQAFPEQLGREEVFRIPPLPHGCVRMPRALSHPTKRRPRNLLFVTADSHSSRQPFPRRGTFGFVAGDSPAAPETLLRRRRIGIVAGGSYSSRETLNRRGKVSRDAGGRPNCVIACANASASEQVGWDKVRRIPPLTRVCGGMPRALSHPTNRRLTFTDRSVSSTLHPVRQPV